MLAGSNWKQWKKVADFREKEIPKAEALGIFVLGISCGSIQKN